MDLLTYNKLLHLTDRNEQLELLGYDPDKVKVSELEDIIRNQIDIDVNYVHKHDYIKIGKRKFYVLSGIDQMNLNDFSIYKSITGYIYGDSFDENTDEAVVVDEKIKIQRLFENLHKILALTTYEKKSFFRKPLSNDEKMYLYEKADIKVLFFFIQLFRNLIQNSVRNYKVYNLMKNKLEMEEPIV